jgi:3'(2'), 5'-bisphosphate nucleotidase
MDNINQTEYLASACEIAREAGKIIMDYFQGDFTARKKADNSPVTEADIAANNYITAALSKLYPDTPIIAEEDETIASGGYARFFLVDPLDGTLSFIRGEPEFTVNIALIEKHKPVSGVIYCPPQDVLYYGLNYGPAEGSAYKQAGTAPAQAIKTRTVPDGGLTVVRSRSHPSKTTNEYLEKLHIKKLLSGSSSVKFCMVAEGSADLYPRFGRTMEWDTAAGHAILSAAGGRVETTDGKPLLYGKQGFENPPFIAFGSK